MSKPMSRTGDAVSTILTARRIIRPGNGTLIRMRHARASRVVARYRELVLVARRADAAVALVIPALAVAPDAPVDRLRAAERGAPRTRAGLLASRAHARSVRALAGSYALPVIDTRPALEDVDGGSFVALGRLSAAGREQLAQVVAKALAERLAPVLPGCRTLER